MASSDDIRARITAIRDHYVSAYKAHVGYLITELTRHASSTLTIFSRRTFEDYLSGHRSLVYAQMMPLKTEILDVASAGFEVRNYSQIEPEISDFARSLGEEAMNAILSQIDADSIRVSRYFPETLMNVLHPNRGVNGFVSGSMYRSDSLGRRMRAERFIFATINSALFKAYNDSIVYRSSAIGKYILSLPGEQDDSFELIDYGAIMDGLNPFSEPIVSVDHTLNTEL